MANFGAGYGAPVGGNAFGGGYGASAGGNAFGAGYGAPVGGGAFGGFPGGYNQTPAGIFPTGFVNPLGGAGAPITLGANLPPVNPNSFPGTVHFGPSTTYGGETAYANLPGGAGFVDPNLGFGGSINPNLGTF